MEAWFPTAWNLFLASIDFLEIVHEVSSWMSWNLLAFGLICEITYFLDLFLISSLASHDISYYNSSYFFLSFCSWYDSLAELSFHMFQSDTIIADYFTANSNLTSAVVGFRRFFEHSQSGIGRWCEVPDLIQTDNMLIICRIWNY